MSKRESESFSVKDLMQSFIKENNLSKGMQKLKAEEAWNKIMGNGVVGYTDSVQLKNQTLIVRLKSSALREELTYGKEKIVKMLNEEIGDEVIFEVDAGVIRTCKPFKKCMDKRARKFK